ncbi:MAG TPA: hypothetical protein PKH39_05975 [Woeseiaceae bacterium]|nr:hypothetical protein [Woeseiaceae bacterium]
MNRAGHQSAGVLLIVFVLSTASTSIADEGFYESLPEVTIGKVFFSPQQRAELDQRRGGGPVATSKGGLAKKRSQRKANDDAAGFIISSKGSSKVYSNGDFVSVHRGVDVKFPGSVKVLRSDDPNEGKARGESD